ncbi:MAG: type II toxin-antitoxin system VapC family toxin, partial [Candidatus Hydrogenedentota bacterium]
MKKRVYIETTIPSYLAAFPARDLLQAARQRITHDWWKESRQEFELYTSVLVLDEIAAGDPGAASRRAIYTQEIEVLRITNESARVADAILASGLLPPRAARDAVHIGIASTHGIDLLLTWNCRHIANAAIMSELDDIITRCGHNMPILC